MIKRLFTVLVGLALVIACSNAQATVYDYSYTFNTGGLVSGSFTGNASGNLITNLSNISLIYNNTPVNGSGNLYNASYDFNTGDFSSSGTAVASFNGLQNNLLFIDSNYPQDYNYTNYFYSAPVASGNAMESYFSAVAVDLYDVTSYNAANWHVVARVSSAVPEPSTLFLLVGGLLGLVAYSKRSIKTV